MQSMRNWLRTARVGEECEEYEECAKTGRENKKKGEKKRARMQNAEDSVGVEKKLEVVGAVSGGRNEEEAGRLWPAR